MPTDTSTNAASAAIWQRVVEFQGELSPSAARALLKLQFSERDHARMDSGGMLSWRQDGEPPLLARHATS